VDPDGENSRIMALGRIFIAGMLAFGLLAGLVIAGVPALRDGPVPTIVWPVLAGLAVDLALHAFGRGRVAPLTMNERAIGIIGSGIITTVIVAFAAR